MHQLTITLHHYKRNCISMGYIDIVTEALTNLYQLHHYQCRGTEYTVYFGDFITCTKLVCYLQKALQKNYGRTTVT